MFFLRKPGRGSEGFIADYDLAHEYVLLVAGPTWFWWHSFMLVRNLVQMQLLENKFGKGVCLRSTQTTLTISYWVSFPKKHLKKVLFICYSSVVIAHIDILICSNFKASL